jgi:hypothetical protein
VAASAKQVLLLLVVLSFNRLNCLPEASLIDKVESDIIIIRERKYKRTSYIIRVEVSRLIKNKD